MKQELNMAKAKNSTNLEPYPSSPTRPPRYNVWLKYGEGFGKMQVHNWCTDWAAWKCLEIVINGRGFSKMDTDIGVWYVTDDNELMFKVVEPTGDNLIERKPQNSWVPGGNTMSQLQAVAGIIKPDEPKPDDTRAANKSKTRTRAPVSRDGLVSIGDICADLGMNPRDARKILRGKVEKPDAGWCWPTDEADAIKKLLK